MTLPTLENQIYDELVVLSPATGKVAPLRWGSGLGFGPICSLQLEEPAQHPSALRVLSADLHTSDLSLLRLSAVKHQRICSVSGCTRSCQDGFRTILSTSDPESS